MKAFFYLPLDFGLAGTDQDDDLPDAVAVEEVIYDLESSGIPVEDDEVIRHYELVIAGIGIFDEAGNVVRDVTDNGACEGDHSDDDYDEADDRDRGILRSDIFDDIGDAACIKNRSGKGMPYIMAILDDVVTAVTAIIIPEEPTEPTA